MSAFNPVEQLSRTIWGAPLRHDDVGEPETGAAGRHDEGFDPLRVLMTLGGLTHAGSEFAHAAGHAGHVAHGPPKVGMSNILAPFALLSGIGHIQHSLHDKQGLEKVANVAAGGAEAVSGGIGTMGLAGHALNAVGLRGVGSALTGLAGSSLLSTLGAVGGAFAAGWSIGTLLDETFGLSDKLSGPGAIEQAGMVETKQRGTAGIADSNQRWVMQEVERLKDENGENGPVRQYLAIEKKKTSLMDEKPLIQSAHAIYQMQKATERQQAMAERYQTAQRLSSMTGMYGDAGRAMRQHAVEHYAD